MSIFARLLPLLLALVLAAPLVAQTPLQDVLQANRVEVANPSRASVGQVLAALREADAPGTSEFLRQWQDRMVVEDPATGLFHVSLEVEGRQLALIDLDSGAEIGRVSSRDVIPIRPNAGVRREIGAALVRFELSAPDPSRRLAALEAIARSPDADQIPLLESAIPDESDADIRARKLRLLDLLNARFATDTGQRIAAIKGLSGDVSTEARRVLNQILATEPGLAPTLPTDRNIARVLIAGQHLSPHEAYDRLVAAGLAPARPERNTLRDALLAHVADGAVAGLPLHRLSDPAARIEAYGVLQAQGLVPPLVGEADIAATLAGYVFFDTYLEPDPALTDAARAALDQTATRLTLFQWMAISLDALSLASIFFLAAIGLAITFGVMRVINMAHGEFIMMGAYTGYVVQTVIPDYTVSLIVALPLAFVVAFGAGVAMERLVIRHLYTRPLETLLATFGMSIALQQLAKNIFGTQAKPLTAPDWLAGAISLNDVVSISTIRVAIFVLALIFLAALLIMLKRTRLGLEVRAVTQNPGMAASMGINPDRINMLTFGLGSGIAGVAGVAIGLYAQVTSEMGANYIVQSFMTVVVGGVGNVWGTLAGAGLIGFLQKGIEWFNPSNTLAAQTFMVLFIILFIQFRPRGIIALKGRAAGE
ncbi:urea ABC transporter permease subunit UrtB [uncultured Roseicyclus sp.]|uniref:urea ABC transporter permease subunit UrtB n=1 Tax=uncultured Roseicyclus sp. TaxID=543072 RepID=UPI0026028613|nr:urea ABC transporter permease subunit UrtB [uncultured Roseicyclus sp.]